MQSLSSFRKPDTNKTMGVEIEGFVHDSNYCPSSGSYEGFFYATTDGSLWHPSWEYVGREFVSQPLPREWLKKEVRKLFKKVNLVSNDSCGVHVHVSRKWLSVQRAARIQNFYSRLSNSDQAYLFGRASNEYCMSGKQDKRNRYQAVSINPDKTIEFRMFKSGDADWVCYCLDMVDYLIRQAKVLNIDAAVAFRDSYKGEM